MMMQAVGASGPDPSFAVPRTPKSPHSATLPWSPARQHSGGIGEDAFQQGSSSFGDDGQTSDLTSSSYPSAELGFSSAVRRERSGTMHSDNTSSGTAEDGSKAKPLARGSACVICRKRKLKCDGLRPRCGTCVRLKHDCQYGDPVHEKLTERTRELEEQVHALEQELQHYRASGPPAMPTFQSDGGASALPPFPTLSLPSNSPSHPDFHGALPSPYSFDSPQDDPALSMASSLRGISAPHSTSSPQSTFPIALQDSATFPLSAPIPTGSPFSPYGDEGAHRNTSATSPYPVSPFPTQHTPQATFDTSSGPYARYDNHAPLAPHPSPGATSGYDYVSSSSLRLHNADGSSTVSALGGHGLPPTGLLVELTQIYFVTVGLHLPFLNRPRFLYTLHHPPSLSSNPTLALVYAVLAAAALYHNAPSISAKSKFWYECAKETVDKSVALGVQPSGAGKGHVTVEMVQALCILSLIEMGRSDHQRAFLTIGQAVRITAILGLPRMDEDRIVSITHGRVDTRLRPPALHALPQDPVLLEECRRTMCAVFVIDRLESSCVGWPSAIAEEDIRLLLPCPEELYETGTCTPDDNPLWWQVEPEGYHQGEVKPSWMLGGFAWLCRVVWISGRICAQTYRPSGDPAAGPFLTSNMTVPLEETAAVLEMDRQLDSIRARLNHLVSSQAQTTIDAPLVQALLVLNCLFVTLHHLRVTHGLSALPFDQSKPSVMGSAEYSMQRCLEGIHSIHEIVTQLANYDNLRMSLARSRVTTFSSFLPYISFCFAFPAKFTIGDWALLGKDRTRIEQLSGRLVEGNTTVPLPSGDDVFGPALDDDRLEFVSTFCEGLDRMGTVWTVAEKFSTMVRGDRQKLAARAAARQAGR